MTDGEISKQDLADRASGASDGGSGKFPLAPQAEPAPAQPAQSQDCAAPRDPAPAEAAARGSAMELNAAAEQETSAALGTAATPETAAAAAVPVRSGPAEMASRKEAAVQTAVQPTVVCAVCSGSSESVPLHPSLFATSVSELPLPDDSSSGSEADEVLALGRKAAIAGH
ncbi:testis-specific gene A8 protein-like [Aphelocoma coerulescens]|uniref:testis-specific gene A8 protein-like n=1 Tax=Aphelocoma coerulescens TaxID=39617 RepID=UPI003604EAB8